MRKRKHHGYAKYGYIFSIPFMVAFILFSLYPIVYTALIGFTDLKGLGMTNFHFLTEDPFRNFKIILTNPSFQQALRNTVFLWICNFIPQILLALLLTAWFTDKRSKVKGQGLFKVLFYMPNIITAATVAILFNALFGWMWYGYTMVVLISGVLGISPEIFEAAEVDGANRVQTFFYVTIPNIKTILLFTLVTSLIGGLNMFDIPKLFLLGGPDNATLTTSVFIYNQAFSGSYMYNRAAAASMIMFLIICVISAFMFYILRDKDEELRLREIRRQEKKYRQELKAQKRMEREGANVTQ